jgi:hypothetical protein
MSDEPDPQGDIAGSLIAALEGGGEYVDDGAFTLDAAKARAKLREHQLADPHAWVLLAISAGVLATAGLGPVHVRCGSAETEVSFGGVNLSPAQLEHCFAAVFGRQRGLEGRALREARVLHLLGLVANAALSFRKTQIIIESTQWSGERHRLSIDADGQSLDEQPAGPRQAQLRVIVRARGDRKSTRERELILDRCRHTSASIFLANVRVSEGPSAALVGTRLAEVRVGRESVGIAGFQPDGVESAQALIVNRGVLVETLTVGGCLPGFVAIVEVDLPMDLSQRQVVRNADWDALMTAIRSAHAQLPKPISQLRGLASESGSGVSRVARRVGPWLAGVTLLGFVVGLVLDARESDRVSQLEACEHGNPDACRQLLDASSDPIERRPWLEKACQAGDQDACLEHAEAVYFGTGRRAAPKTGLAMLLGLCERGDARACDRARALVDNPRARARLERASCRLRPNLPDCTSWIEHDRGFCKDVEGSRCADLREALTFTCKLGAHEDCIEAGWMLHLGYGGKRYPDIAKRLFEAGCEAGELQACEWTAEPPVSERRCRGSDPWSCFALGVEAYTRGDLANEDAAREWFTMACEAELDAGCEAAERLREGDDRGPALVLPMRVTRPE